MPTHSEVSICSNALTAIGDQRITSLDEDSDRARLAKAKYYDCRDSLLRECAWQFAMKRVTLAPASDTPAFGFDHYYDLPADCMRPVRVLDGNDLPAEYTLEAGRILSDEDALYVTYVSRVTDPNLFDPMFRQALEAFLSATFAYSLSSKQGLAQQQWGLYAAFLKRAKAWNEIERPKGTETPSDLTDVR